MFKVVPWDSLKVKAIPIEIFVIKYLIKIKQIKTFEICQQVFI
jgi:hypothetical protein